MESAFKEFNLKKQEANELQLKKATLMKTRKQNQTVRAELESLSDAAIVHREVGTVLISQEKGEALSIIDGRIRLINEQIKNTDEEYEKVAKAATQIQEKFQELYKQSQATS